VKYADNSVVLPREETITQGMNDILNENGRFCGKEKRRKKKVLIL
jgi:hypothetical protein